MANQAAATPARYVSQVARDRIRKDTIEKVTKNQIRVWPSRWNWIAEENLKMYEAMAGKRPLSPYVSGRFLTTEEAGSSSATEPRDSKTGRDGGKKKKGLDIMLPPIPPCSASSNVPVTTNGWYGFVPKVDGHSMVSERQRWCKVTVGQHNLAHAFGWPDIFD